MIDLNYWAVLVAGTAGFVAAFVYYVAFGKTLVELGSASAAERPPAWVMPFELGKHLVLAVVVAGLTVNGDVMGWTASLALGLALWVGFPVVLLASSVVHEKVPAKLAALHAGDWLAKLLIIAVIVGVWT